VAKKYSVILMRDDSSVKRFRLRPFWIRFFIALFVVMAITSVAGIYLCVSFFHEKNEAKLANEQKAAMLEEAGRELEKRKNIQQIMDTYDTSDLHALLTGNDRENSGKRSPAVDLGHLFVYQDMELVEVNNVRAGFVQDSMRVELDVNNKAGGEMISGQVFLDLIRRDATLVEVEHDDLEFSISRFRSLEAVFNLPQGVTAEDIFALRIRVEDEQGNRIYAETLPLSLILV